MLNVFVSLLIFLAPINLFFKVFETDAYVNGIFIDYLVVKFYLVEIVVAGFFLWWLIKNIQQKKIISKLKILIQFFKKNIFLLLIILILLIKQFFTPKPIVALWQFARFFEFGLLGFILWENAKSSKWKKEISKKIVKWALLGTIIFQSGLGLIQFYQQKPLLPYRFLGETQFTRSINISKIQFKNSQKIPPHGTTAHPNILAGMLVIYTIALLELKNSNKLKIKLKLSLIIFISLIIFLTQSYSAILALAIYLTAKTFKKIKKYHWQIFFISIIFIPLLINFGQKYFPQNTSLSRRAELNKQAVQMFLNKPLFGAGMGQFTTQINQRSREVVRFIQPAHHVGLLWIAETGLLGIALIILVTELVGKSKKGKLDYSYVLTLIPLIALDHYLLTQWVGLWLVAMLCSKVMFSIEKEY